MLGLMINHIEQKELEYLIKRELDEILFDLDDNRIDNLVKGAMKERYKILFQLLRRVANERECIRYMPKRRTQSE
ncbi:hypothetical protein [Ornithinibacillus halotolerans]|uniref:Uncharacterized protein n=1 Tax=Ornithinibacillus halotolerans TaxID=1274357 RepID=A0A916S9Z9_9BACI|nr:hypothetical protein [Ornithinibacillus halotolerans]GGA87960.1 hypothetical protein GCM10008025_33340 [Ornithinibacillus halotolerans]